MLEMQTFHNWLSSAAQEPDAHRRRLARLTRANRTRLVAATSELTWSIWSEAENVEAAE